MKQGMRFLREWVLHNWGLKLLALALAFLLWATYTAEPLTEVSYLVPIEIRDIPDQVEISGEVPAQAQVRVRGREALVRRLAPAQLAINVDLRDASPGELLVPLSTDKMAVPYGVSVVRITPAEIRLRLVPRRETSGKPPGPARPRE